MADEHPNQPDDRRGHESDTFGFFMAMDASIQKMAVEIAEQRRTASHGDPDPVIESDFFLEATRFVVRHVIEDLDSGKLPAYPRPDIEGFIAGFGFEI